MCRSFHLFGINTITLIGIIHSITLFVPPLLLQHFYSSRWEFLNKSPYLSPTTRVGLWVCTSNSGISLWVPVSRDRSHQSWSPVNGRLAAINQAWLQSAVKGGMETCRNKQSVCGTLGTRHLGGGGDPFVYHSYQSDPAVGKLQMTGRLSK